MTEVGIDTLIIPTSDCHNSEYVGDCYKAREYFSGFTGSAGTLIVTSAEAYLYTDGRYFIQAEKELEGSGIRLMRMGEDNVPPVKELLKTLCPKDKTLGFGASLFTIDEGMKLLKDHPGAIVDFSPDKAVWPERPDAAFAPIYILDEKYAGESCKNKLARIRHKMSKKGANAHIVSSLDNIAWITNLRGSDIEYCPLFYAYLCIFDSKAYLYARTDDKNVMEYLDENGITLKDYGDFYNDLEQSTIIGTRLTVLLDKKDANYRIYDLLSRNGTRMIFDNNPSARMKAVKNATEIDNFKKAHVMDAAAIIRFERKLRELLKNGKELTELSAAKMLHEFRSEADSFISDSFETISAFGQNGAIVHYSADESSDAAISADGILLVDSGGHYYEGTTDITRTYILGEGIKDEIEFKKFKADYTLVLKSMLKLMDMIFPNGTKGSVLDGAVRSELWNNYRNFNHGTGHGVGYLLNVHEGPNRISYRSADPDFDVPFEPGMITSDEPGIYVEGKYGIRTENLLYCTEKGKNEFGTFLGFEPLTAVPIDKNGIDMSMMSDRDIDRLNRYHSWVYANIAPYLEGADREFLERATEAL